MSTITRGILPLLLFLAVMSACGQADNENEPGMGDATPQRGECNARDDINCIEIQIGEQKFHRWFADYQSLTYTYEADEYTVMHLHELIDSDITNEPQNYRYQMYGTDGYTFGGFASWENMQNGYMVLGERRVLFDPSQQLPHSFNVKLSYLMVLSPVGG